MEKENNVFSNKPEICWQNKASLVNMEINSTKSIDWETMEKIRKLDMHDTNFVLEHVHNCRKEYNK